MSVNDAPWLAERLLILRCQTGDEAALAELISRYSPGLRLYLRKMSAQAAVDDLLQETWFDVYRKINGLRQPEAFVTWLYRIARDKLYRELRRKQLPADEGELFEPVVWADETFSREDAEAVRTALDDLAAPQREVLVLRFIEDLSYEQIAQVIDRPVGTVRSRIHYGLQSLRQKLRAIEVERKSP